MLAGGAGRRFGGDKLVAPYLNRPLLSHVLQTLRTCEQAGIIDGWLVIGRRDDRRVQALVPDDRWVITNSLDAETPYESLVAGLAALAYRPADAALIVLGDQPVLSTVPIVTLVRAHAGGTMSARAEYSDAPGVPGHPVLLDRSLWSSVSHCSMKTMMRVPIPGINPDIDTRDDLDRLEATFRMQLTFTGESSIGANRTLVWNRLMDPAFVWAGTSGVERLTIRNPDNYELQVGVGVGMLRLSLVCDVTIFDCAVPDRAQMRVHAVAGGMTLDITATTTLVEVSATETRLHLTAATEGTGILATLPPRLVESTIRALSDRFWADFGRRTVAAAAVA